VQSTEDNRVEIKRALKQEQMMAIDDKHKVAVPVRFIIGFDP
jgi:hypothetical protein